MGLFLRLAHHEADTELRDHHYPGQCPSGDQGAQGQGDWPAWHPQPGLQASQPRDGDTRAREGGRPQPHSCPEVVRHHAQLAAVRSACSHMQNMFTGVQRGYKYTMKLVYAHFPINVSPTDGGKLLEIRNFLGEKVVRKVPMKEGVVVDKTGNKDEIALWGNSIENVGSSASLIHQVCMVKRKDIRKFLDGVYVSEKGHVVEE